MPVVAWTPELTSRRPRVESGSCATPTAVGWIATVRIAANPTAQLRVDVDDVDAVHAEVERRRFDVV
jgi:hypothetical protein